MLAEAEQNVKQLKAAYDQALANVEKVNVQVKLAQEEYDRKAQLFQKQVIAQAALDRTLDPISDHRGSGEYRLAVSKSLVAKFLWERREAAA